MQSGSRLHGKQICIEKNNQFWAADAEKHEMKQRTSFSALCFIVHIVKCFLVKTNNVPGIIPSPLSFTSENGFDEFFIHMRSGFELEYHTIYCYNNNSIKI